MKRKQLILWGAALLSAVIGLDATVGKDAPESPKKGGVSVPQNGAAKTAETTNSKKVENVDTKPQLKNVQPKTDNQPADVKQSADEVAIRLTGETFVKAHCQGDAQSIAAHFTPDAEYIDEQGNVYQGRKAIEGAMKALFADNPGCQIELDIEQIRIVSPGVAVEDGTTTFTASGGADPIFSRYTAVHVKADGKWLSASVREHAPKDRRQHRVQLQHLAWLRGDWVDESDDSVVIFSCDSIDGGNFLLRKFVIRIAGQEAMTGTQRIGWDPQTGKLKAWIFDSEGGHSDGFWHREDDHWVLKTTGVTADGQTASGTSIYTFINEDTMTWQSVDCEIGGMALPDSDLVTIVRRAPVPEVADQTALSKSN